MDWIKEARPVALGLLGLLPRQFYGLTPAEFKEMVDGHIERRRQDDERTAAFVCVLANAGGNLKKPLTPDMLIGSRPEDRQKLKDDPDEFKARAAALADRLNRATRSEGGE